MVYECALCEAIMPDTEKTSHVCTMSALETKSKKEQFFRELKEKRQMENQKENTQIITVKEEKTPQILSIMESPEKAVVIFNDIKKNFRDMLIDNGEIIKIHNNEYVKYEGWSTIALVMGIMPEVTEMTRLENGYQAKAVAKLIKTGNILGAGFGICSKDENNWKDKPDYAISSMAQTRACGKALKTILSGVIQHMGFEATPAEEIDTSNDYEEHKMQGLASEKQIGAIFAITKKKGIDVKNLLAEFGEKDMEHLTKDKASKIIDKIQK
jgi:hypothetical protein